MSRVKLIVQTMRLSLYLSIIQYTRGRWISIDNSITWTIPKETHRNQKGCRHIVSYILSFEIFLYLFGSGYYPN